MRFAGQAPAASPSLAPTQSAVSRFAQIFVLALAGLSLRIASFGDPVFHLGDEFYRLVGIAMHEGAVPYVDIWDRKPFGLFFIYYLIAAVSRAVVAYQIAAWISASLTAYVINLICERWTSRQGAMLAGVCYLVWLSPFWGGGGEAAVFYNLPISLAAYLLLSMTDKRILGAMLLCGLAITIKQTAVFESLFFGLAVLAKRQSLRIGIHSVIAGASPTLLIALWYRATGHWPEFWRAMVVSNLTRTMPSATTMLVSGLEILLLLLPLLMVASWSVLSVRPASDRFFVVGWFFASVLGFFSVPTLFPHYVLPLLPPLCIAISPLLGRRDLGPIVAIILVAFSVLMRNPFVSHRPSIDAANQMAEIVQHDRVGRLLVFDGPSYLYTLPGRKLLSPLVFPNHLNHLEERDVSHIETSSELSRILQKRPSMIVMTAKPRNEPPNTNSWTQVRSYIRKNCGLGGKAVMHEMGGRQLFEIWRCRTTQVPTHSNSE